MSSPVEAPSSPRPNSHPQLHVSLSEEKATSAAAYVLEAFPGDGDTSGSGSYDISLPGPMHQGQQERQELERPTTPRKWKCIAVLLASCIAFGATWTRGTSSAMKAALKRELHINNTRFALLEASEDFMVTLLILPGGLLIDRLGGPRAALAGNTLFSLGGLLVAAATQTRNFSFMISGRVVQAAGEIAVHLAQLKILAAWFPPSQGFGFTLGIEIAMARLGLFVGKATANPIAEMSGDIAWVFWVALFMSLFANMATFVFYRFNATALRRFGTAVDPATGEPLTQKGSRIELRKLLELPWAYWCIVSFSIFETTTAVVFLQNATEMAQNRFGVDAIAAGWYAATLQLGGIVIGPFFGVVVDMYGSRLSLLSVCGFGVFASMAVVNWIPTAGGTAIAFGLFGLSTSFGATVIADSVRTSMYHQLVFGSAMAIKMQLNHSAQIIARIITAIVQDQDDNSYDNVTAIYVAIASGATLVSTLMHAMTRWSLSLDNLQWTRKQRLARGDLLRERRGRFHREDGRRNRLVTYACFAGLVVLTLGSWTAFFWGVAGRDTL